MLARRWTSGAAPLGLLFGFFAPTQPFSSSSEIGNESTKYTKPLESVGQVPHTRANFNFLSFLDRTTSSFYSWKGIQVSSFERRHFSDKKQDPENRAPKSCRSPESSEKPRSKEGRTPSSALFGAGSRGDRNGPSRPPDSRKRRRTSLETNRWVAKTNTTNT